ncbi:carbohydrate sulfotransferase 15-like isoform X2 [Argopecten irradians]|uniref:carbohydrate sulfotransferase 15-like isoform X2 n=1 Tax=Argopecten irradians TaxID=31199 RepID=UPI0037137331
MMHTVRIQQSCAMFGTLIAIYVLGFSVYKITFDNDFNRLHLYPKYKMNDFGSMRVLKRNNTKRIEDKWIRRSGPFELLKRKPPVYLPELKNPCWYGDGDDHDRRQHWMDILCRHSNETRKRLCSDRKRRTKNIRLLRCLPYFMLVGQHKCGTTDLFKRIASHPDVKAGLLKEPEWFSRRRHCQYPEFKGLCNQYVDQFDAAAALIQNANDEQKSNFITGEGTPVTLWDHIWWWAFPENKKDEEPGLINAHFIRHLLPDVKILVILRNPVDRLYSDYLFFSPKKSKSEEEFHKKTRLSVDKFKNCLTKHSIRHCAYKINYQDLGLHGSLYSVFLKDWMTVFPRKQFFITTLEEYSKNQTLVASEVFTFLGLRAESGRGNTHFNSRRPSVKHMGDMYNETRRILEQFYKPFNRELAALLDDPKFLWGS